MSTCPSKSVLSKITGGGVRRLFAADVLGKHHVNYYQCNDTGFIQTDDPYWLDEAYSDAISALDVGCVSRNLHLASRVADIINRTLLQAESFVDFGGGYGLFVRLMRDAGFPFVWSDPYCANAFARGFSLADSRLMHFDVLTAFEVFEHMPQPLKTIEEMFALAPTIIFSTELAPASTPTSAADWWYFVPEAGQHVAFFTLKALEAIARRFDAQLHSDGQSLHILTRRSLAADPFSAPPLVVKRPNRWFSRHRRMPDSPVQPPARMSLLQQDFEMLRRAARTVPA